MSLPLPRSDGEPSAPTAAVADPLFNLVTDLLCVVSFDGQIVAANERWRELFGWDPARLRGTAVTDWVHEEDRDVIARALEEVFAQPHGQSHKVRLLGPHLPETQCRWTWRPMAAAGRVVAVIEDLSEVHNAISEFQTIIETAPNGLLTVNDEGKIVGANGQIARIFGYTRQELMGMTIEDLVPARFRHAHVHMRDSFVHAPATRRMGAGRMLHALRRDGSEFPIEIGLTRATTTTGGYIYCSIIDVTDQKRQEQELRWRVAELQRHRNDAELVSEMSSLLQHAAHEGEALSILSWFGPRLFTGVKAGVYIRQSSGGPLELAARWNECGGAEVLDPGDCWALRRAQIHRSVPGHPARCAHVPGRGGDEQESLCIPLSAHGHWLGVMTMSLPSEADLAEGRNMEELEGLARSVADQFGMALSNLQLRDRLRTLSIRDPLTGLYNRRYLEETVQREVHRALRHRTPLSVLMVDVDHFKAFNDNHGHQMADGVLRSVATTLSNNTRAEDVACRYGGEEFVLLLPDAAIADAASRADYLRQLVYDETEQNVTVSIGVASFPTDGSTWEEVLKAADDAMYRAKARGRDQVVVSGDHSASARTPKGSSDPSSTPIGLVGNPV